MRIELNKHNLAILSDNTEYGSHYNKRERVKHFLSEHFLIITLCLVVLSSCLFIVSSTNESYAYTGKSLQMTTYDNVIKKGNTVYCCDWYCIYKVNLKTRKVK